MSTDVAVSLAKKFIRQISQPFDHTQTGISLWTLEDIEERQRQDKDEAERVEMTQSAVIRENAAEENDNAPLASDYMEIDDAELAGLHIPIDE